MTWRAGKDRVRPARSSDDPTRTAEEHLRIEAVCKRFGDSEVLRDVEASVRRAAIDVIIGGSGAGKTTLLRILGGLDKPTSGHVFIGGLDIVSLEERALNDVRKRIGMVFQYSALLDWMTVFENLAFPLREHTALDDEGRRARVIEKLEILGLDRAADKYPAELSGGMRKRVALARALILEPEVVLYDEPTSGLDPVMARHVDELIMQTRDRFHVTSIVISHDMAAALRVADQVHLLSRGTLIASGAPRQLLEAGNDEVREFFESSGVDAPRLLAEHDARAR